MTDRPPTHQMMTRQNSDSDMKWLFFGVSGRISRVPYVLGSLFLVMVGCVIISRLATIDTESGEFIFWSFALVFFTVISMWATIALAVKRLHDLNIPGPVSICLFVPAVSIIAVLVLCFWPGNHGPNDYGAETNQPKDPGA